MKRAIQICPLQKQHRPLAIVSLVTMTALTRSEFERNCLSSDSALAEILIRCRPIFFESPPEASAGGDNDSAYEE